MDSVNFNALDQRFITGLYLKEALLRDRSENLGKHFIVRLYARLFGDSDQKKLDDTEAEILYQRTTLEQREVPLMKLQETPSPERARRNPMRETATIRWSPTLTTDLMEFHRQSFSKQVLEHPQKAAVVKERFSEDVRGYTPNLARTTNERKGERFVETCSKDFFINPEKIVRR